MRKAIAFGVILLVSMTAAAQTKLLRQPTYSNGRIAFSYFGDIWIVNEDSTGLRRLTDHPARDISPRFSPDGQWIAFSSNREGNNDVYIVSPNGGKPRQLTFNSAEDMVVGWTPDSKKIIFTSSRAKGVFPGVTTLMEVSVDGGMEQPIPTDWGSWASYSPDGSKMAFTRHPGVWSRRHYRGSYNVDLWLMDVNSKQFTKLADPDYKGNYLWPMYGHDGQIYFVADRLPDEKNIKFGGPEVMKSVNNIWRMPESGGTPVQVTHHTDGNLYFPSMSADGKTIVYEDDFGLWKLDVASGQSTEIRVEIRSDVKENEVDHRTIDSQADDFSLSPSGRRVAIETHGEIFTVASDRGEPQRVTESFWREEEPRWSPNGKWIAFTSDRSGREEVWMADERGHNVKQLSDIDCDKGTLVWSPDSKFLLYSGSDHKLRKVEIDGLKTEEVTSSDVGPIGSPQFSPDGKWVSYSKEDSVLRSRVYVKKLDGGEEHMIGGEDFLIATGAKWTPDGKKLLLLGGSGAPSMASLNRSSMQLYSVALTHITKNPDDRDIDTEEQATSGGGDSGGGFRGRGGRGGAGDAGGSSRVEVKIEWDGLDRRIRQLTRMGGSVSSVIPGPDSRTYVIVAFGDTGGGLFTISEDGSRLTPIATGGVGDVQWSRDGRSIYYMQGSGVWAVAAPGGGPADSSPAAPATGGFGRGRGRRGGFGGPTQTVTAAAPTSAPRRITFNVRLEVDSAAERKQVFEEAWRVMRNRFYDPKMHGVDWDAAKARYEPLLDYIADVDELHNVIMEMIGEMNASHTGISGGGNADFISAPVQTRHPGFDLEPDDASGFYKVSYIYKHGPADHDYVKLNVGDYILAVNDKELKTSDNYWQKFNLYFGRKFEFTVNNKPETDGSWTVSIEPLSAGAKSELDYERWVDSRKAMVEKLSNGQFGYLHIRAMDAPSLQKFQRDLLDNIDKKALIIDERFNGGGGIDQELLEILNQRKKYESWRGRNSVEVPRPSQAFFGPMVVLQNERSASDAEMFPEGFRTLGLGKLVGVPTYGAVIGTGAYRLLDGSQIRTPAFGVYTATGVDFENYGVQPDVLIDNTPADFLAGHDRQIEKAVETLKSQQQEAQAGARSQ
jgi:tricorn protease